MQQLVWDLGFKKVPEFQSPWALNATGVRTVGDDGRVFVSKVNVEAVNEFRGRR